MQDLNTFLINELLDCEPDEWEDVKGFIEREAPDEIKALVNLMGDEFLETIDRTMYEVSNQITEIQNRISTFSNAEEAFADYLNDTHGDIQIAGSVFDPAEVLEKLDPYGYKAALGEYTTHDYDESEYAWRELVDHLRKLADKYPQIHDFCKATLEQVRQMLVHEVGSVAEAEYQDNLKHILEGGEL